MMEIVKGQVFLVIRVEFVLRWVQFSVEMKETDHF